MPIEDNLEGLLEQKFQGFQLIAEGGFSRILLAQERGKEGRVAIKLLKSEDPNSSPGKALFTHELDALRKLQSHPGIIQLQSQGETAKGTPYAVLEFLEGRSVAEELSTKKRLSPTYCLSIMTEVLAALSYAHARGILHLDLKPEHVILTGRKSLWTEKVKLIDFNPLPPSIKTSKDISDESLHWRGTPEYMSPEQACGITDLSVHSDIYSAGLILYEMLSGRVPFRGDNVVHTLFLHLAEDPPHFDPALKIPPEVEVIVRKALRKAKEDRYQSCDEFLSVCEQVLTHLRRRELLKKIPFLRLH